MTTMTPPSPVPTQTADLGPHHAAILGAEELAASLGTRERDPQTRASELAAERAAIVANLPRTAAVSAVELDEQAEAHVTDRVERAARTRVAAAAGSLDAVLDDLVQRVEAAAVARRTPTPDLGPEPVLTAEEQEAVGATSTFAEERRLAAAQILELRALRRDQARVIAVMQESNAIASIGEATDPETLLHLAAIGNPAEQKRADTLLRRLAPRPDRDPAVAMRELHEVRTRHAAIVEGRVPPEWQAAEQAEKLYTEAFVNAARMRATEARMLLTRNARLEGLFVQRIEDDPKIKALRDAAARAWAAVRKA